MFHRFSSWFFRKFLLDNKILSILTFAVITTTSLIYLEIVSSHNLSGPDPDKVMLLVLIDLIILIIFAVLLTKRFILFNSESESNKSSRLQSKILTFFNLGVAVPTILVSIFSVSFFNFGIQSWFDQKITTVLDQSIKVAESYVVEHTLQLKETALSVADDLNSIYYELIHKPGLLTEFLNAQAEMRSLNEAIIFQKSTNTVLAQTTFSFSLSFATIPAHLIERADRGEIVEINSDPAKIRILIKLREYNDTYLLIGRLIDKTIIDHVNKTSGALQDYYRLKKQISNMQIKFSIIFILVTILLLIVAIAWGMNFAGQIVRPIKRLVKATDKVKKGDLTVQVEEVATEDEIAMLSSAFNIMVKQLNHQQRDLVIAQRALAWSDVARRVAHEIKNPLTPIQLAADRLQKKFTNEVPDPEAFNKYVQTILRHTEDIKKIVAEFVNFARLPSPSFAECDIIKVLGDIVESRRLINDKINYQFTSNIAKLNFICDTTQINQVMVNLLKNSEEALDNIEGKRAININVKKEGESLSIIITDNGSGFPEELLSKATEAYITTRSKGMGLGLAIVKKIIQDHSGNLEISNNPKGGAMIKLIFNLGVLITKIK